MDKVALSKEDNMSYIEDEVKGMARTYFVKGFVWGIFIGIFLTVAFSYITSVTSIS